MRRLSVCLFQQLALETETVRSCHHEEEEDEEEEEEEDEEDDEEEEEEDGSTTSPHPHPLISSAPPRVWRLQ